MADLREQVAAIVREARENQVSQVPYTNYADRILDIPAIKAAQIVAEASPEWIREHFSEELAAAIIRARPEQT